VGGGEGEGNRIEFNREMNEKGPPSIQHSRLTVQCLCISAPPAVNPIWNERVGRRRECLCAVWRLEKWWRLSGFDVNSPKRIVNDGESELEILHDSIDPTLFKAMSGDREEKGYFHHSHPFNDSINLVSPLRSFRLPMIKHDAMLNLFTHTCIAQIRFARKTRQASGRESRRKNWKCSTDHAIQTQKETKEGAV